MIKCVINYEKQAVHLEIDGNQFNFDKTFNICIAWQISWWWGTTGLKCRPSDERFHITVLHD